MTKRSRHPRRDLPPQKPELEISSNQVIDYDETFAPGEDVIPLSAAHNMSGTSDATGEVDYQNYAPVQFPSKDSLTIHLVPKDLVYQLEEYRSDENRMAAAFWVFFGGIIGVIINWATSNPIAITIQSIVVLVIISAIAVFCLIFMLAFKRRADNKREEIDRINEVT